MPAKQAGRYPAAEYARKLLTKYPDAATMTLARRARSEHPKLFRTLNQARQALRMQRGELKCGRSKGKMVTMPVAARSTTEKEKARTGGVMIPPGKKQIGDENYNVMPGKEYSALILSDIHVPYHDAKSLTVAIEQGQQHNVKAVILNGDFMDFYAISRYATDPRERDFPGEIETGRAVLQEIRKAFPKAEILFKCGNHEDRYEEFMWQHAPQFLGVDDFNLAQVLRLRELSIKMISTRQYVYLGKLLILHGHELGKGTSAPVNAARTLYLKAKDSSIMGHLHHSSSHSEKSISDHFTTCWSVGCLCDLKPRFAAANKWNHGFAVVEVESDGNYRVNNFKLIKHRVYPA